jgi:hypothetical protein
MAGGSKGSRKRGNPLVVTHAPATKEEDHSRQDAELARGDFAPDQRTTEAVAVAQFDLDDEQRRRPAEREQQ